MLIKFSKQIVNSFAKINNGFRGDLRILPKISDRAFCKNSQQLKVVHYLCKNLHLGCLTRLLICYWIGFQMGTTIIFSFGYQSCTWPRSGPFCWQNPRSSCKSHIFLNMLSFNFVSTPNKSFTFTKFRRNCVNRLAVVLTNHCQSYTAFLQNNIFS